MAFNTAERWAADVSEDVARKVMRRIDLAGDELVSSLEEFVERHWGRKDSVAARMIGTARNRLVSENDSPRPALDRIKRLRCD